MSEIVLVAPDASLASDAEEILAELNIGGVTVLVGAYQEGVEKLRSLPPVPTRVVVSRGGTALSIRRDLPELPIVEMKITPFDVLTSLYAVRSLGHRVAIVGYPNFIDGTRGLDPILRELFHFSLRTVVINDAAQMHDVFRRLAAEGIELVLGGGSAVQLAPKYGMRGVLLRSGRASILQALTEAVEMLGRFRAERARTNRFQTLLDYTGEGVLGVDANGAVSYLNQAGRRLLGLEGEDLEGRPVAQVFPQSLLPQVLRERKARQGVVVEGRKGRLLLASAPVLVDGEVVGGVETFQSTDRIQTWEQGIRRGLHEKGHVAKYSLDQIVGRSPSLLAAVSRARRYAATSETVLIYGETGVGKELFAQGIHLGSPRRDGPFVAINCAALPESLLESELFGYVAGAFSGARREGRIGLFELAHRGTIFLDEVGKIPLSVQSRLLRVLQEKEICRVGGDAMIPVDVRVVAASNVDLYQLVQEQRFQPDLYYRLNVLPLVVPPLRERKEDLPLLVQALLDREAAQQGRPPLTCSEPAMRLLMEHDWPGNVRELENVLKRVAVVADGPVIHPGLLREAIEFRLGRGHGIPEVPPAATLDAIESDVILRVLAEVNGNRTLAAQRLGISTTTLWRRLKKMGTG